ncbi:imidazole glycerol phosphate synthase subunit HisH [Yimella sp. cx-573]|nr:imidazole glycerol phosphate synthase subunit HisH [Yimella sp. cx-573]
MKRVVVLDYGSGNVRSVVRMLERVGADVTLTADPQQVLTADGLYVPGVGNFHACMAGLNAVDGGSLIRQRVDAGRPVLGVCVGYQVLFADSAEPSDLALPGLGLWPGEVGKLDAAVVPHMGWSTVDAGAGSTLLEGLDGERFYFVHSFAPPRWKGAEDAVVSTAQHGNTFVAAVEEGVLAGTQFHPEKSGDAGAAMLTNWFKSL